MSRVETASNFATIYWNTRNRANLCTLTLLAWLSAVDGRIAEPEERFLRRIASAKTGEPTPVDIVLELAQEATVDDLELVCRYVLSHFSKEQKQRLAELAITLTAQDGHITVGENYVLQFLADLLNIKPRAFAKMFEQITHRPYPEPGDPSSLDWWQRRHAGQQARPAENLGPDERSSTSTASSTTSEPMESADAMTRGKALRTLNLNGDPTADELRAAFRKLAKTRHPDRFVKLGPAAVAAATESFQKLEAAYDYLKTAVAAEAGVA